MPNAEQENRMRQRGMQGFLGDSGMSNFNQGMSVSQGGPGETTMGSDQPSGTGGGTYGQPSPGSQGSSYGAPSAPGSSYGQAPGGAGAGAAMGSAGGAMGEDDMTGMGGEPGQGGDPMVQLRDQFQTMISQIQGLSQQYPMAAQPLDLAAKSLVAGMVAIVKVTQAEPTAPPMGV